MCAVSISAFTVGPNKVLKPGDSKRQLPISVTYGGEEGRMAHPQESSHHGALQRPARKRKELWGMAGLELQ